MVRLSCRGWRSISLLPWKLSESESKDPGHLKQSRILTGDSITASSEVSRVEVDGVSTFNVLSDFLKLTLISPPSIHGSKAVFSQMVSQDYYPVS